MAKNSGNVRKVVISVIVLIMVISMLLYYVITFISR